MTTDMQISVVLQHYRSCIDSKNLTSMQGEHPIHFVGGLNTRLTITNLRWRRASILKQKIIVIISAMIWLIATKLDVKIRYDAH